MPYTKEHKNETRKKILKSAFELFTAKGFDGVTINELMENCGLTRGAFYAHFSGKSALYNESLQFAASSSKLSELRPSNISNKKWLCQLLDGYLSLEHVSGDRPCPLAFLTTDVVTQDQEAKETYANVYEGMNKAIMTYVKTFSSCNKDEVLSVTAMIIGAVAISRTLKVQKTILRLLSSSRLEAGRILGGI
jgi:TetR/AcrR family transcriptional repressor of nem operon